MVELPEGVHCVRSRGREYYYWRPGRGTKDEVKLRHTWARLPDDPRLPEFWHRLSELGSDDHTQKYSPGTFGALIEAYQNSPEWSELSSKTRKDYEYYHAIIQTALRDTIVRKVRSRHVLEIRDSFQDTPAKANYLIRCLSSLMSWGIPRDYLDLNPCTAVKKLKGANPYSPWPWEDILFFRDNCSSPELWWAVALALYTGQRQSDVLKMARTSTKNGLIRVVQEKTGTPLWLPQHKDLQSILEQIPLRATTILTNTRGAPWRSGFKSRFVKEMDRKVFKDLKGRRLVFHGLRKSAVVMLLEAGCTDAEVGAVTGQSRQMIEHYSIQVNQIKLAKAAILKWESADK